MERTNTIDTQTESYITVTNKKHIDGYLCFLGDSFVHCTIDTTGYNKDIYIYIYY